MVFYHTHGQDLARLPVPAHDFLLDVAFSYRQNRAQTLQQPLGSKVRDEHDQRIVHDLQELFRLHRLSREWWEVERGAGS